MMCHDVQLNIESIKRVARFPTPSMSDQVATEMALLAFPGFKLSKAKVLQKIDLSEKEVEDIENSKVEKTWRVCVFQSLSQNSFQESTHFHLFHPDLDVVSTSTEDFGSDLWVGWPVAFLTFADTIDPSCSLKPNWISARVETDDIRMP